MTAVVMRAARGPNSARKPLQHQIFLTVISVPISVPVDAGTFLGKTVNY
jgi:hypothetical protein